MKHRLCLPELNGTADAGRRIELGREHAHYLGRVLRLKPGTALGVFDGQGSEWQAVVVSLSTNTASVIIESVARTEPRPAALVLAQAWLKGSAMDTVVQKAVELGVTEIRPVLTEHSNIRFDAQRMARKLAHLERVVVNAAQQCRTLWLPPMTPVGSLSELLATDRPGKTLFFDPGQAPPDPGESPEPLTLIMGPEGGWSDGERALATADDSVLAAGLGPLVLRAETAPLAALAAIRQSWGWRR